MFKKADGNTPPDCDYGEIHIIFNHKNVWANLQHSDPVKCMYELHDDNIWLPYIRDSIYPHKYDNNGDETVIFKKWNAFLLGEKFEEIPDDPSRADILKALDPRDYRVKGEFL